VTREPQFQEAMSPAVRAAVHARRRMRQAVKRRRQLLRVTAGAVLATGIGISLWGWASFGAPGALAAALLSFLVILALGAAIALAEMVQGRRRRMTFEEALQHLSPVEARRLVTEIGPRQEGEQQEVLAVALQALNRRESAVLPSEPAAGRPTEVTPATKEPPALTGVEVGPPREGAA
jgi:hypothetical protein